jgi:hypothetical protein
MSVCVYSVYPVLCVGSASRRADTPSNESYRLCKRRSRSGQGLTKGCTATDREIDRQTGRETDRDRQIDRL